MAKSLAHLIPDYIRGLSPYVPGRPIEEVERELKIHAVKLASNENPLGPSPLGLAAARKALEQAHRYPDGGGHYLREKLAAIHRVQLEQILLGCGSTEVIDLAARVLLSREYEAVASEGSFPLYYISARAAGARLVQVPLRGYDFDLDGPGHHAAHAGCVPRKSQQSYRNDVYRGRAGRVSRARA